MGEVFDSLMPYYQHLGGRRVRDIAIYYSLESKFNMSGNGSHVRAPDTSDAHTESSMQAASHILSSQLPLGVITKESLADLGEMKVLILSNVNMMDEEECEAIRSWVHGGGSLLASGGSSLVDKLGRKRDDFMLADVYGVSLKRADWSHRNHYIAPTAAGRDLFADFDAEYPAFCRGYGFEVRPHDGTEVLATTTLPWPAPDPTRFSSVHSDPPWQPTENPEIVRHRFGKGLAVYSSSLIELLPALANTFVRLVRMLGGRFRFEGHAPTSVEATLFHQPDHSRYRLCLVNFQERLPNIPVLDIEVALNLQETVRRIERLPGGEDVPFSTRGSEVTFRVPRLDTLAMLAIHV